MRHARIRGHARRRASRLATLGLAAATGIGLMAFVPAVAAAAAPSNLLLSEYVEGSSNNKAIEIFNGTGATVDLAAGGYQLEVYFNGSTTPAAPIALTGSVADGDVVVVAAATAGATILAQADITTGASLFNGDDAIVLRSGGAGGTIVDSFGQIGVDPGTEWGTGLTSTADNTLRRLGSVTAGDTDPNNAFDPAAQWTGFATDTFDGLGAHSLDTGGPVDQPAVLTCGAPLATSAGIAAERVVTAIDPDDTIVNLNITSIAPATGSITRTAVTPASGIGGQASATVAVDSVVPNGSYAVTMTSTDSDGAIASCVLTVQVNVTLTVGEVQGPTKNDENARTDRSPLAPPTGNGTSAGLYDVQGVITQRTLARTAAGASQYGFFLQSRTDAADSNPETSDGIFVFMGNFTSLIGGYSPTVGDEVIIRARVSEFFFMTQLSSASLVSVVDTGVDVNREVTVDIAAPPALLVDADRFWERHEGARLQVRAGSGATSGRDVFPGTADSEIWLIDKDSELMKRADPFARRVYRDPHPLDDIPDPLFDNGNGQRIMLGSLGVKWAAQDSTVLLPPARVLDTLSADAVGGLYLSFDKYGIQVESAAFTPGADPSTNAPPAAVNRNDEFAIATFNVENLYDYRDDPFDGCDFTGNTGCPGVSPPFDYVPASIDAYNARLADEAQVVIDPMKTPDIILVQEAEDQDICTVTAGALTCGTTNNADGKPDTLQELALTIAAAGGPVYDAAYDRDGADARGIVAAFLYRPDRVALAGAGQGVLSATPGVEYRSAALGYNADVQNPKSLNAILPADVDRSTGVDGSNVYTRAPQVAKFLVASAPGSPEGGVIWAISNHFSSTPNARVGQRTEQAAYGAAIIGAISRGDANARIAYGGDFNVFPRPDDPIAVTDSDTPSDQLRAIYDDAGMLSLWDDLVAAVPSAAYSYTFQGQAQTLDNLFVSKTLHSDLIEDRIAHVNAGWPADYPGDGARGVSDHDPNVARFRSRATLTVADISVQEGNSGTTRAAFRVGVSRPLSQPILVCAATVGLTARDPSDFSGLAGCKILNAGAASLTFTASVKGDTRRELNETFAFVVIAGPYVLTPDLYAIGTIVNDD